MEVTAIIDALEKNKTVWQGLFYGASPELQQWRPGPEKWNLHEVLCHLLDEERLDFRARIKHILETPDKAMPGINPEGWVLEKDYASWDYSKTLIEFLQEREHSIEYLHSLRDPNWQQNYEHPMLGTVTAEMFLYNWLAHDYLHIRQVNRYHYQFLKESSVIDLSYAGTW